ncbi:hypothetical protein ACIBIZ_52625 [Nonomuraea spiralis]|nr:hypothetical protein [Nonomuraea sp. WAC 01424]
MAKDDDQNEAPLCAIRTGADGERIHRNGDRERRAAWTSYESRGGTGRK